MVGIEGADEDAEHHAKCHDERHVSVLFLFVHSAFVMSLYRYVAVSLVSEIDHFYSSPFQEVDAVRETVFLTIYHALDTRLDDEFGTLDAG